MDRYAWSSLNHLQIGRYAEYFMKMEFTMYGFDVYSAEVDDKGIDFVIRRGADRYYDVQVKSKRGLGYVFFPKATFELRESLLAAVALFEDGRPPDLYLIPSTAWGDPRGPFVDREYGEGMKSAPEWGLNIARRSLGALEPYKFDDTIRRLRSS